MKATEFRRLTLLELQELEKTLHKENFNLHIQKTTGQLVKPDQLTKVRKNIARLYTVISERSRRYE